MASSFRDLAAAEDATPSAPMSPKWRATPSPGRGIRRTLAAWPTSWRIFLICTIKPIADALAGALRELGHEPVALVAPRRSETDEQPEFLRLTGASAPPGLDLLFAQGQVVDRAAAPRVRARPDGLLGLSRGRSRRPRSTSPRLGSINQHPALLPRHRGPIPFAWTLRDRRHGVGLHVAPHGRGARHRQHPRAGQRPDPGRRLRHRRVRPAAAGGGDRAAACGARPGRRRRSRRPAAGEGATWAGHFEDDDYVRVDWSQPARAIHDQVRAWHLTFGMSGLRAPVAELDGEEVVLLQTRLADPGNGARRVECGDGPIWVVASEPRANPPAERGEIIRGTDGVARYVRAMWRRSSLDRCGGAVRPDPGLPKPRRSRHGFTELAFARGGDIWTIGADGTRARPSPPRRVWTGLVARRLETRVRLAPLGRRGDLRTRS